jgi:hypothetical protein
MTQQADSNAGSGPLAGKTIVVAEESAPVSQAFCVHEAPGS